MSENIRNMLLNCMVLEGVSFTGFTLVLCGLFSVKKCQRKSVIGLCAFKLYFLNLVVWILRYDFFGGSTRGFLLSFLNTIGIIILVGGLHYCLGASYPKILVAIAVSEIIDSPILFLYLRMQGLFFKRFPEDMSVFSLPGTILGAALGLLWLYLVYQFLYKFLGKYAQIKLPFPWVFTLLYGAIYMSGVFTYMDLSWENCLLVSIIFIMVTVGILYIVHEITRRKVERDILREYQALRQEKEAMEKYQETILVHEEKQEELKEKMKEQLVVMEQYMQQNPENAELGTYMKELKSLYQSDTGRENG
ncbi:MAG: hypothetical protein ACOX1S_03870 [Anaerostipes sp.]|jgi:hypothetical protein